MIKQVFVPLVVLGKGQGDLLELYIESRWLRPNSCFSELTGYGLDNGIALAEKALTQLQLKTARGMIYSGNAKPLLSNSLGTAAGLVLASLISEKSCPYQSLIVSAAIDENTKKTDCPLKYNGFWQEKLAAVLALPKQANKTPFILAADTPIFDEQKTQLLERNIYDVRVNTLRQAIDFCLNAKQHETENKNNV